MLFFLFEIAETNLNLNQSSQFLCNIFCSIVFLVFVIFVFIYAVWTKKKSNKDEKPNKDENYILENDFGSKQQLFFYKTQTKNPSRNLSEKKEYYLTPYFYHKIGRTIFPPSPLRCDDQFDCSNFDSITFDSVNPELLLTHPNKTADKSTPYLDIILENNKILYAYEKNILLSKLEIPDQYEIKEFLPHYYVIYIELYQKSTRTIIIQRRMAGYLSVASELFKIPNSDLSLEIEIRRSNISNNTNDPNDPNNNTLNSDGESYLLILSNPQTVYNISGDYQLIQ